MKLRFLLPLLILPLLNGCMMVYGAMEAFSEHGIGGVLPNPYEGRVKKDAYLDGFYKEKEGDERVDNIGNIKNIRYGQAYEDYLVADYVGDIRAKEKLLSLSKKLPVVSVEDHEADFRKWTQKRTAEGRPWEKDYAPPPQYNRNLMKK